LNLGLKYPEIFSVIFSLAPGALRPDELELALKTWQSDKRFKESYAAAFLPFLGRTGEEYLRSTAPRKIWRSKRIGSKVLVISKPRSR
jgi:hypothetical protein